MTSGPEPRRVDLVTGAFGNVGSAIARRLESENRSVRTLTNRPGPAESDGPAVDAHPLDFEDRARLIEAMTGVDTFYNTYWMRTGDETGSYAPAVERCRRLIDAAATAGVRRIVHISVAHPSARSPHPYFRGKAAVEEMLDEMGAGDGAPSVAIVRPALIFGGDSVLLNNLAWMLRRLPVMAVAGRGDYRVRPVHVDDIAAICVTAGAGDAPEVIDAVGPDRPTYRELVLHVRAAVGGRARVISAPVWTVMAGVAVLGRLLGDRPLTRDELVSTMNGLADTGGEATGPTSVMDWITEHGDTLGRRYHNESAAR